MKYLVVYQTLPLASTFKSQIVSRRRTARNNHPYAHRRKHDHLFNIVHRGDVTRRRPVLIGSSASSEVCGAGRRKSDGLYLASNTYNMWLARRVDSQQDLYARRQKPYAESSAGPLLIGSIRIAFRRDAGRESDVDELPLLRCPVHP